MIEVYIRRSGDHYNEFYVEGHANYAEMGKDIVCSAVSALTITLENALGQLLDVTIRESRYVGDSNPRIFISAPNNKTDLLIGMYKIGIEGVQEAFPDHVKLHLET